MMTAQLERDGDAAVERGAWSAAANLFDAAAQAVPPDVHGVVPADTVRLHRRAHVADSMHRRLKGFGLERAFVKAARP